MTQETAWLDYSKPPPGYRVTFSESCWWASDPRDQFIGDETFATQRLALVAAWAHYKAEHDPPGIETVPTMGNGAAFVMPDSPLWGSNVPVVLPWVGKYISAGTAAWAWHGRRHELAGRMSAKPSHRRWYSKAPPDGDMGGACVVEVHRTAEAARRAVLAVLEDGSEGWPEDVEAVEWGELVPMAKAQEYNREETPEGEFDYMCEYRLAPVVPSIWPRCLTWTDEQVAEVERWLQDSTAKMPEVLRDSEGENPC